MTEDKRKKMELIQRDQSREHSFTPRINKKSERMVNASEMLQSMSSTMPYPQKKNDASYIVNITSSVLAKDRGKPALSKLQEFKKASPKQLVSSQINKDLQGIQHRVPKASYLKGDAGQASEKLESIDWVESYTNDVMSQIHPNDGDIINESLKINSEHSEGTVVHPTGPAADNEALLGQYNRLKEEINDSLTNRTSNTILMPNNNRRQTHQLTPNELQIQSSRSHHLI